MPTNVPLQSIKLASTATTFVFSNIDQSYSDLRVVVSGFTDGNSVDIQGKINGDTGANYSRVTLEAAGSSPTGVAGSSQTYARFGWCPSGTTYQTETLDFLNYSDTSNFKMVLQRASVNTWSYMAAINWRSTAAITSLEFTPGSGTFNAGTTFSLYGIRSGGSSKASGGDIITTDGTYWYHTFLRTSAFTPVANLTCDYLVVAGGGSGGHDQGGGGGAGGYRTSIGGSQLSLGASAYTVTIGAGAAATGSPFVKANGSNSVFSTITSSGGGGAGGYNQNGNAGGSGAGGGGSNTGTGGTGGSGNAGSYSPVEGYAGGTSPGSGSSNYTASGGGGASAVGANATAGIAGAGGNGGAGTANSISGTSVTYAGGGGGGCYRSNTQTPGSGGAGGGGAGAGTNGTVAGTAGTANLGAGGGGGSGNGGAGGNGGSGIVIVRYAV